METETAEEEKARAGTRWSDDRLGNEDIEETEWNWILKLFFFLHVLSVASKKNLIDMNICRTHTHTQTLLALVHLSFYSSQTPMSRDPVMPPTYEHPHL